MSERIGPDTVLPARRAAVTLTTADGLCLVGELALPADREPRATVILLHPNPLGGGSMDTPHPQGRLPPARPRRSGHPPLQHARHRERGGSQ
ncbi:hypothetical protein [Alloactinosynnema sp. L-07]|uniref:hypothetical protein n=1 Tax=Alloactinosynnema sp. L-07 TaxID=1653480 RepID=UPI00065EF2A7|nr:hypothetical protein [Alloactinosynnema sp. L-07]CRK58988.1 hypothetical protein [Alloactinosynnema sp. L-07]